MKNLIEPSILEAFKVNPPSLEEMGNFLDKQPHISAAYLCKIIGMDINKYYDWKYRKNKARHKENLDVVPSGRRKYTASDKLKLIKEYTQLEDITKTEFLRKYGLYQSDIARWIELSEAASLEVLSRRKVRNDKKSEVELEIEHLKKEISSQEKTITKLAALVVIQKKVSEILTNPELSA
jgi:transposase-like protein